ncbi:MAG: MerR family transcriptional regulator, partial [Acidimicrobiia bacterium]|nr:MerR family transcriptional regulator [Acidimicrobiia bacterium]
QRIQQLTEQGLNLAGVKRVLELEAEVDALSAEIERLKTEASEAVAETHRQYRRDIVPVSQSVTVYQRSRRRG